MAGFEVFIEGECFRRAYVPFMATEGRAKGDSHFPEMVKWILRDGSIKEFSSLYHDCVACLNEGKVAHMPHHWQDLLQPLEYVARREEPAPTHAPARLSTFGYSHLGYEQIPELSFLSLNNPARISRGDQIRIAFSQGLGTPGSGLPYSSAFLNSFEDRYCYDRFYDPALAEHAWMRTRYFVCPYALTVLCDNGGFAMDDRAGLLTHYRHHYYQLALLAHLQKATLMLFRHKLHQVIPTRPITAAAALSGATEEILTDLVSFSSTCRFAEVAVQEQGQDLYGLLVEHLEIERLYIRLFQHAETIFSFFQSVHSTRLNNSTVRLTVVATFGLALALGFAFWSMQFSNVEGALPWIGRLKWRSLAEGWRLWGVILVTCLVSSAAVATLAWFWPHLARFLGIRHIRHEQD